jgi:acetolactate synthase-1/2/3 large subunit
VELLRPITKFAETPLSAWRLPEVLSHAFTAALSPRYGPALVDLPFDVLMARLPADEAPPVSGLRFTHPAGVDPEPVARVARWLAEAQRPVLFAGSGAHWTGAGEELRELAVTAGLPLYVNGLARGLVPARCGHLLSLTRREALAGADLILVLGADFDFRLGYGRSPVVAADARVVHVDPQADRIGRNRQVDLGLVCDVRAFLRALLDHAGTCGTTGPRDWLTGLQEREARKRDKRRSLLESDRVPIHPLRFAAEVARFADPDAVLIGDGGDVVSETSSVVQVDRPGHWLDPGPFGCLGVGAPFALGARLARPDKQVLVIFGDGAFGFNGFEYDSAVRQKLPFVGVIGNDGAWGEMRTFHEEVFGPDHMEAQYLCRETRYEKVVEALGGYGERVDRPEDIAPALRRAQDSGVPAVVNVLLDPTYRRTGSTVSGAEVAAMFGGGDPNAYRH